MSEYVVHFNEENDDGEEVTKRGRLIIYHEPEGQTKVELANSEEAVIDNEQINQMKWQKWETSQQEQLFD